MKTLFKPFVLSVSAACLALLPACSASDDENGDPTVTEDKSEETIASALGTLPDMTAMNSAISSAGLGSIFDGPGSYTVLAPNDEAFRALGDNGAALLEESQRPLLVGILRNHILPGHLTPEDIGAAIDAQGGEVTMTTLGDGTVTFSREGGAVTVTNGSGATAQLASNSTAGTNGVIVPLDTVLTPSE